MHENEDRLRVTILSPKVELSVAPSTITDIELPPDGRLLFLTTLKRAGRGPLFIRRRSWNSETCPAGQPLLAVKVSRT